MLRVNDGVIDGSNRNREAGHAHWHADLAGNAVVGHAASESWCCIVVVDCSGGGSVATELEVIDDITSGGG